MGEKGGGGNVFLVGGFRVLSPKLPAGGTMAAF